MLHLIANLSPIQETDAHQLGSEKLDQTLILTDMTAHW